MIPPEATTSDNEERVEAEPIREVLHFASSRPPWQQDLIRRLYLTSDLTQQDLDEVFQLLKAAHGLVEGDQPTPVPLSDTLLRAEQAENQTTILRSIKDVSNANQLARGQTLTFCPDGLTVIYGYNASGKSGYTRLLKKLCRVRVGGEEPILGNIFETGPAQRAKASVTFSASGKKADPEAIEWTDGTPPPSELSRISVFDAHTAPLYVDAENKIEFLPRDLDLLQRLGTACGALARRAESETARIDQLLQNAPLPTFDPNTPVGRLIGGIQISTPVDELPEESQLRALGTWSRADDDAVSEAEKAIASDPKLMARRWQETGKKLVIVRQEMQESGALLRDDVIRDIREQCAKAKAARDVAAAAAKASFEDEPLGQVGSEAWRLMYRYAKEYSTLVYPDDEFPVVGPDKYCLLCQQSLKDEEASERFRRFQTYVEDAAEKGAVTEEARRAALIEGIARLRIRSRDEVEVLVDSDVDELDAELRTDVVVRFTALEARRTAIKQREDKDNVPTALGELPPDLDVRLESVISKVDELIAQHQATPDTAEHRKGLERKLSELQAKKQLSTSVDAVIARARQLRERSLWATCKAACGTKAISDKNNDMRDKYLTTQWKNALFDEIKSFGLGHIPLRLDARTDRGTSYLAIGLETSARVKHKDILSEGEYRALAIACFMTEVARIPGQRGVIIDDPVSSLDHLRAERVSQRIVDEAAKKKQVVVLTHNLPFYFDLVGMAEKRNVPVICHWVRYSPAKGFGVVDSAPWEARRVSERVDRLRSKLSVLNKNAAEGEEYRKEVKDFYGDVRDTWERLVEELLFNGVVRRFQRETKTKSLRGVEIQDVDVKRVDAAMTHISRYCHDAAAAAPSAPPSIEQLEKDLAELDGYERELRARIKTLENRRA